jgi:hypothetical protein
MIMRNVAAGVHSPKIAHNEMLILQEVPDLVAELGEWRGTPPESSRLRSAKRWNRSRRQRVRLYSRPGNDLTPRFPLIVDAMARLPPCTIDGEAVACDDDGLPSFELLRHRRRDARVSSTPST